MPQKYLIQNGTMVSILDGSETRADILVENGIISRIAPNIEPNSAETIDAEGMYITTGWLEAHCHFLSPERSPVSLDPVRDLLQQGVTYALDLGSVGPLDFVAARDALWGKTDLRYRSYLNISTTGIYNHGKACDFENELEFEVEDPKLP